jgi:dUTP pyrophosphatase
VLDDEGDELAEEIQTNERWVTDDLTVPVQLGEPEAEIRDLPRLQKQVKAPARRAERRIAFEQPEEPAEMEDIQAGASKKRGRTSPVLSDEEDARKYSKVKGEEWKDEEKRGPKMDMKRRQPETPLSDEEEAKRARTRSATEGQPELRQSGKMSSSTTSLAKKPDKAWRRTKELVISSSDESLNSDSDEMKKLVAVGVDNESTVPKRATTGSACYDITAASTVILRPGKTTPVDLRLRVEIPDGYFLVLSSRSGLALKGITTQAGIIDSDYRGPVRALLRNESQEKFTVKKGQRITQAFLLPVINIDWTQKEDLDETTRGASGFGSTGDTDRIEDQ